MPTTSVHDLKTLILSFHAVIAIETLEEQRVADLLQVVARETGLRFYDWTITQGLVRRPEGQAGEAIANSSGPLELLNSIAAGAGQGNSSQGNSSQGNSGTGIFLLKDFGKHLKDPTVIRKLRELSQRFSQTPSALVITGSSLELSDELEAVYYTLEMPTRDELYEMLQAVVRSLNTQQKIKIDLDAQALGEILKALQGMTLNQARQIIAYAALTDNRLSREDIEDIQARKIKFLQEGGLLEYYPPQDNSSEIGGFSNLKAWVKRAQVGFSAEAQSLNLTPPKGILIVGVQGCGKSLAAKIIARDWQLPLLKLDAGRLYDKYVGESEKNLRRATAMAAAMAPAVLWLDELEKGFSPPSESNDGGTSQRMFGTFLTWLQEKKEAVFVVATANDLSKLPPELMRKGRFDEIFFVDLPDAAARKVIFEIHLDRRKQDSSQFDLQLLVNQSAGFSGAEIEQAVVAALYRALHLNLPLNTAILQEEVNSTVPLSVSCREDIEALRAFAQERFVSAE
ncbi:MAG: AAA family ATPase [Synechococcales cyanobacterium CRU_2_2]|nr:AAA family ATPase [Synechococcales cyanobacterium CRU_2_2]